MKKKTIFSTLLALFIVPLAFAGEVKAYYGLSYGPNYVVDQFHQLVYRPNSDAYWYALNWGNNVVTNNQPCGDASCVEVVQTGFKKHLRLSLLPDTTPGTYTNAELAERNTGLAFGEPGKYKPTFLHPVIAKFNVKWSDGFKSDLSGDAVGTSGIWLWNSPVVIDPNNPGQGGYSDGTEAFGVTWAMQGTVLTEGLNFIVARGAGFPTHIQPLSFNMNQWNEIKYVWSEFPGGNLQKVEIYVNDVKIHEHTMLPMGELTLEMWHDNQKFSFTGSEYQNPTHTQYVDVDSLSIVEL